MINKLTEQLLVEHIKLSLKVHRELNDAIFFHFTSKSTTSLSVTGWLWQVSI
jgi:hypothetical protein